MLLRNKQIVKPWPNLLDGDNNGYILQIYGLNQNIYSNVLYLHLPVKNVITV